ncbi:MAG: RNB domain-containing ribonuclease [Coriobacteriia bacterium]|nr:RNB domain-containing ribonuclease [Coriobacteriia bacterium]
MPRGGKGARGHARRNPEGVLQVAAGGYGFVDTPEGEYFIPASKMGDAFDGDVVEVKPTSVNHDRPQPGKAHNVVGKKPTARVVGVVRRAHATIIGRYEIAEPFGVVIPEDSRIQHDIFTMHADNPNVHDGDVVRVRIVQYPTRYAAATGVVEEVIGRARTPRLEIDALVASHNLRTDFPPEALADAGEAQVGAEEAIRAGYVDLRDRCIFTIDPPDARDFDDALSLDPVEGGWRLGVHIADVSWYVPSGSAVDAEARLRATSVYLVDRVIPMLPEALSNGVCSLAPNEDRRCVTVDVTLSPEADVLDVAFYPAVMRSCARLDYGQVQALFDSTCPPERDRGVPCSDSPALAKHPLGVSRRAELRVAPPGPARATDAGLQSLRPIDAALPGELGEYGTASASSFGAGGIDDAVASRLMGLRGIAQRLKAQRRRSGALDLESSEVHMTLDDGGTPVGYSLRQATEATELVEQCMILANTLVAQYLERRGEPAIFRVHESPDPAALGSLVPILQEFDYGREVDLDAFAAGNVRAIQDVLEASRGREESELVSMLLLRAMKRAVYAPECAPHFGLALDEYLHFTSPIRRYPDLVAHRALKHALGVHGGGPAFGNAGLATLAEHSSAMERTADEAARQSQMLKLVEYLAGFIGSTFEGVISKVATYGFFVQLDSTASGLVDLGGLGERYTLDVRRQTLTGQDTGRVLRVGQRVRVVLVAARPTARELDFELAD